MRKDNSSTYNTITIVFLGLSAFVCIYSLLLMTNVVRPPSAFVPRTLPPVTPLELPTVTPTETPTITPTPTDTPTPTPTLTPEPATATPTPDLPTNTPEPTQPPPPTETPQVQG